MSEGEPTPEAAAESKPAAAEPAAEPGSAPPQGPPPLPPGTRPGPRPLPVEILCSRQFTEWLQVQGISLAFTTYQTGCLMLLGVGPDGKLSAFQRRFDRAMGMYCSRERLLISGKYQIWQLDDVLRPKQRHKGYDALYIPRVGYTTGDLDVHDLCVDADGRIVFAASLLNALATVSERNSCTPLWTPPFISRLIQEDRCHLNGLAMKDGYPAYVSCVGRSDVVDGWRDQRRDGGVIVDLRTGEAVVEGLSMPHSPRWHDGQLWVCNSGRGELGRVDLSTGAFEPVVFCPGYMRGLAFWGQYAIVGLSKPRDASFSGLELDDLLREKHAEARCGLMIVDLESGAVVHWVRLEGRISELYDVGVLPGVKRPMALGFQTKEIDHHLTFDPMVPLFPEEVS